MAAQKPSPGVATGYERVLRLLKGSSGCRQTSLMQTAAMLNVPPSEAARVHAVLTVRPGR